MARAGETPTPQYKQGNDLNYGDATAANVLGQLAPTPGLEEDLLHQPQGEEEEFIFGPTDRPAEPITHGAPFGPGADMSKHAIESDDAFSQRLAQSLASQPNASPEVRAFANRVARGE